MSFNQTELLERLFEAARTFQPFNLNRPEIDFLTDHLMTARGVGAEALELCARLHPIATNTEDGEVGSVRLSKEEVKALAGAF